MYFGTYEAVKDLAGGNKDDHHHPFAAGTSTLQLPGSLLYLTDGQSALSGACATISSDALMNPFDGMKPLKTATMSSNAAAAAA